MITDDQIKSWFAKHKANETYFVETEKIEWKEHDTMINQINYYCNGPCLFITGDLGAAVFEWAYPVSLRGIANANINYFLEKMQASEGGRNWREWDEETAKQYIVEHFREVERPMKAELFHNLRQQGAFCYIDSHESWMEWVNNHDYGIEFFGQDTYEWIYTIDDVPPVRARAWLIGLKMAFEQIGNSK